LFVHAAPPEKGGGVFPVKTIFTSPPPPPGSFLPCPPFLQIQWGPHPFWFGVGFWFFSVSPPLLPFPRKPHPGEKPSRTRGPFSFPSPRGTTSFQKTVLIPSPPLFGGGCPPLVGQKGGGHFSPPCQLSILQWHQNLNPPPPLFPLVFFKIGFEKMYSPHGPFFLPRMGGGVHSLLFIWTGDWKKLGSVFAKAQKTPVFFPFWFERFHLFGPFSPPKGGPGLFPPSLFP